MPTEPPPPPPVPQTYRIVVGIDYSELSALALDASFGMALERDGMIYALAVAALPLNRPAEESEAATDAFRAEAKQTLDSFLNERVARFEQAGMRINRMRLASTVDFGDPASCIVSLASETDADLIVVGTHGRTGLQRMMVGSVAAKVLKNASCSVLVVRPQAHEP